MTDDTSLQGKVAVVTGGGRGIGRMAATQLAQAGASVMITARTEQELNRTAQDIRAEGGHVLTYPADVSDWSAVQALAEETRRTLGPADIVVANASVLPPAADSWQADPASWSQNITINLVGAFYTARAFSPAMVERQEGVLIFVSSGAAGHTIPGWSAYCASKAGVDHFARTLTDEFKQRELPIRVYMVYPGVVATEMQAEIRQMSDEQFPMAEKYRQYYQKEQLRPPAEPATLIRWLATPLAADLSGQVVNIDKADIRQRLADDLGLPLFPGRQRETEGAE